MRPLPKKLKATQVDHSFPGVAQFVWEVYSRPGQDTRGLASSLSFPYFNFNKRVARLVRASRGLVKVKRVGRVNTYLPSKKLTPHEARMGLFRED